MRCGECYWVTEIDGEYVCDCETPKGCDLSGEIVWDENKVKKEDRQEQEAVEPKQVDLYGNDEWWGLVCVCPDCKAEWMSDKADTHFCPKCGQAVKWE